jgi:hypothetical protein
MKQWDKQEIEIAGGAKVMAQMPLIVSASRSTDMLAFYSDWLIDFNTCPHLCHYCYANTNNTAALENWKQHCQCPYVETIIWKC